MNSAGTRAAHAPRVATTMGAHLRSGCTLPHALRAPCRRNPSAARPVVTKAAAVEEEFVRCVKGERLREWVLENGGVVHPSLAVVEATRKTGSRGVVALQPISVETSASEPLVLVPESLYLTSQVARVGFEHYEQQGAPPLEQLDRPSQLAMLLAHERPQGADSFFHPYIDALGAQPSAAWAMADAQLDAAIAALPAAVTAAERADWRTEAVRQRSVIEQHAQRVEDRYKKYCDITATDFFWGMGHVLSRAYGSHPQLGMAPFIDLLNHNVKASAPELAWDETLDESMRDYWYFVTAVEDGVCVAMQPGDELCVSYSPNTSTKMMFMSYGFVPPELL